MPWPGTQVQAEAKGGEDGGVRLVQRGWQRALRCATHDAMHDGSLEKAVLASAPCILSNGMPDSSLISLGISFWELSARPWLDIYWAFLLGFMRRMPFLPNDILHRGFLRDDVADARGALPCANWARGIDMQLAALGIAPPFVSSGTHIVSVPGR